MGLSPQDQSSAILIHAMRQQEFLVRSAFQSFRREVSFSPVPVHRLTGQGGVWTH